MTQEERSQAMKWLADNPEAYECDTEIKLLVPVDQVPSCVLKYIEAQKLTTETFNALVESKNGLGLGEDFD